MSLGRYLVAVTIVVSAVTFSLLGIESMRQGTPFRVEGVGWAILGIAFIVGIFAFMWLNDEAEGWHDESRFT